MNPVIKNIVELLEEARNKFGIRKEDLEKNGAVIYANANDGTDFDWEANDRLCEFGYGTKDGGVWAFKLCISRYGDAVVYCYPHGESSSVEEIERNLASPQEMAELKKIMEKCADDRCRYDCTLDELGLM